MAQSDLIDPPTSLADQHYRHLFQMCRDVIFRLSCDFTILSANPAFEVLLAGHARTGSGTRGILLKAPFLNSPSRRSNGKKSKKYHRLSTIVQDIAILWLSGAFIAGSKHTVLSSPFFDEVAIRCYTSTQFLRWHDNP